MRRTIPVPSLGERSSGVLLHATSLPGPGACGDLGRGAIHFADFLAAAGQRWWQMLPIGPPGFGESPYQAWSALAGSPLLLSLERLREAGLLSARDLRGAPSGRRSDRAEPELARRFKEPRLRRAAAEFSHAAGARERQRLERFRRENRSWLHEYSLFRALKRMHGERSWVEWAPAIARRAPDALRRAERELTAEVRYEEFLQLEFDRQWSELRCECAARGIALLGDVPIYVAHDSADVWAERDLFELDRTGRPIAVAGVPPDYFSATGQLWGNPLYRWPRLARTGYRWWVERLRIGLSRFDALRLDHFIGFVRYWRVPAREATAIRGRWLRGPGRALFDAAARALGELPLVAEDLGSVTREVEALRDALGLPGIRVLQFSFGLGPGSERDRPHAYPRRCVAYTGTHDNDTAVGWFARAQRSSSTRSEAAVQAERAFALRYLASDGREVHWDMIRQAMQCAADIAIVPAQDLLGLGSASRMNRPGVRDGNWAWRLRPGALDAKLAARLRGLGATYGRAEPLAATSTRPARRR
jgi:4-alpha-glucanotransferase